jgi:hypothetical protein
MKFRKLALAAVMFPVMLWAFAGTARSQSSDQSLPTPVLSNEINGRIAALDLGDPRLTRHFYAFEGTPGDLLITIDSKNLNGDTDIFTAITFRPLMKTTLYANSQSGEVTKGLYLRARQILILRVEARSPNDEDGTYHVRFGGSFESFNGGIPVAENTEPQEDAARPNRGSKRLSSVGATITGPVVATPPVAAEPRPTAEAEKPAEDTKAAKKSTAPKSAKAKPPKSTPTARNSRGRTPRPVRPKPAKPDTEAAKTSEAKTEEAKIEEAKKEAGPEREEKSAAADSEKSETSARPKAQELPLPGAHLIIESKDGTKIDRPMSTVRRVVVEGGMIVIVLKTGRIERIPMSAVARMAIEP